MAEKSIVLNNGERIHINDHVYTAAPWGLRDSNLAYSVGRVMEFLNDPESETPSRRFTRARIAWYYRPGDLSERSTDARLLLAAIYSETQPITYIRGKCYVRHRDMIPNLAEWKRQPDCFYFHRFFDPYIKKEYEVLLSRDVTNVPAVVREILIQRYQFVVTEKEVVPDLTDDLRACDTCLEWCSPADAVRCDNCKSYYHMQCVQPPLFAKPAKGYGWSCAPCAKKHEDQMDRQGVRSESPPRTSKIRPKTRISALPAQNSGLAINEDMDYVQHFKLWPFRYFGLYTEAYDTLNPDDFIFPRNPPRVGPKYQAICPPCTRTPPLAGSVLSTDDIDFERGLDETIEILSNLCNLSHEDAQSAEYFKHRLWHKPEQKILVDFLDESVRRFSAARPEEYANVRMKGVTRARKWTTVETRYADREWSDDEYKTFDQSIRAHGGAEMRLIQKDVKTRSIPEIVRFYGRWKNDQLRKSKVSDGPRKGKDNRRANAFTLAVAGDVSDIDDIDSTVNVSSAELSIRMVCGACKSKDSQYWWKSPRGFDLTNNVLCDSCSSSWRKYAEIKTSARADDASKVKATDKREATPLTGVSKRIKLDSSDTSVSPSRPQRACVCCKKNGPYHVVVACQHCGVTVHPGCAGAQTLSLDESWTCELCDNERTLESSMDPHCLLCSPDFCEDPAAGFSYLRIAMPTESRNWVHVLCAVFSPEIHFSDATKLLLVEGLSMTPLWKRAMICVLCRQPGGVTVKCADTAESVHTSCGLLAGFALGFEVLSTKGRKEPAIVVRFKGESGIMSPVICRKPRRLISFCDMDSSGETALQIYCRNYKAPQDHSYGLLRKAQRMDLLLAPSLAPHSHLDACANAECLTSFSPFFWPISGDSAGDQLVKCHQCWTKDQAQVSLRDVH